MSHHWFIDRSKQIYCILFFFKHNKKRPRSIEPNGTLTNGRNLNGGVTTRTGTGVLHEDLEFPPNPKTLSRRKPIVWMRPHVKWIFLFV